MSDTNLPSPSWKKHAHRRYNALTGDWVLVSPHRTARPWQGQVEETALEDLPAYDPACYLCPSNSRAGGTRNPHYQHTFVFENDYAALRADISADSMDEEGLLIARSEPGICRVVCFSPRHDLTLSRMALADIGKVVRLWCEQYRELGALQNISYVQIFENRGAMMGASNPHPHCQIWVSESLPNEPAKEHAAFERHRQQRGGCLLCDYLKLEEQHRIRLVIANDHFQAMVPFWAVWPFETLLISRRHLSGMDGLSAPEQEGLADILKRLTARYDNLFRAPFPYSMGFHPKPTDGAAHESWHLHAHFFPQLLRSATIRKFMVGYEMLGTPQRDITAEKAAESLRSLSDTHYFDL